MSGTSHSHLATLLRFFGRRRERYIVNYDHRDQLVPLFPVRHKFIFLCGLHKSGTSPLFRILREHPQISGFSGTGVPEDEGQHLQSVFPTAGAYGGPGRFGFATDAHITETSDLVTPANADKLFAEWSKHWDLSRPYLLEKSPPNLIRTRFLQAIFPNSHFIIISRHPIAVSLATQKWCKSSLASLIEHWLLCHDLFVQDRLHLSHVIVLQYEDIIRATQPQFERVCDFLGLTTHASSVLNPSGNESYFAAWQKLSTDRQGHRIYEQIITHYETRVRHYGYSLADCNALLPASAFGHCVASTQR
jgi:hypothetical protein